MAKLVVAIVNHLSWLVAVNKNWDLLIKLLHWATQQKGDQELLEQHGIN